MSSAVERFSLLSFTPCKELRLLREVLQDGSLLSHLEDFIGNTNEVELAEPSEPEDPKPQPAEPAKAGSESRLGIRFQDLHGGPGFRQPEAVESLAHLSARVIERRRQGELPLGQVPSIG